MTCRMEDNETYLPRYLGLMVTDVYCFGTVLEVMFF